jgi:DNA-binding LacI/PurR family transcriptional regulator
VDDRARKVAKRPILADVAASAGVSLSLASIVVRGAPGASDETRRRVLKVAADLGYRRDAHASLLRRTEARLIGVLYQVESRFHADLVSAIHAETERSEYDLVLGGQFPRYTEPRTVDTLLEYRCDALILIGTGMEQAQIEAYARSVPVVTVTRRVVRPAGSVDTVRTDDSAAYQLGVNHLVSLGHQRIAHVDGGPGIKSEDRREAYARAMVLAGLDPFAHVIAGGESADDGAAAAVAILGGAERPSAVVCYNDETAWGVIGALTRAGVSVPGDVSVIGLDGAHLWTLMPQSLTTLRQDTKSLASHAVELAIARLQGEGGPGRDLVLPPVFVPGNTTGLAAGRT